MKYKILGCLIAAILISGCDKENQKNSQNALVEKQESAKQIVQNTPVIEIKKGTGELQNNNDKFMSYDINGKKKVQFGLDEENNVTRSIGALAMVRSPIQSINAKLIRTRLSKNFITKCSACHDDYANGIIGPSLLNKSESEISSIIKAYQNKIKSNVLMKDLVQAMSDEEINSLAREISEFNAQFKK